MVVTVNLTSVCAEAIGMRAGGMRSFRRTVNKALMVALLVMLLPRMMHDEDRCVATGINRHAIGVGRVTSGRIAIGRAVIGPKASPPARTADIVPGRFGLSVARSILHKTSRQYR
jgi:hypothetical protein